MFRYPASAVPRLMGCLLLAACGLAAAPSARAHDIGAVIEAARLQRYAMQAPETRAWGTENARDALIVGQLENRLYLYRYAREPGKPAELAFRAGPLALPPESWREGLGIEVSAAAPRDGRKHYWLKAAYRDAPSLPLLGFLIDERGAVDAVRADADSVTVSSDRPWDETRKADALQTLRWALLDSPSPLKAMPARLRFEQREARDVTEDFLQKQQAARAIPRAKAAEFGQALAELRRHAMLHDYRAVDPVGKNAQALAALNDYGFWLAGAGELAQAERVLDETLRRDPRRVPAYLNRADARWALKDAKGVADGNRRVYEALAREDYRLYCSQRLAAGEAVPSNTAARIASALGAPALDAAACRPRLAIFQAIRDHDLAALKTELARGQDPSGVNEYGASALGVAVSARQPGLVRALLDSGADVRGPNVGQPLVQRALPRSGDDSGPGRFALADMLLAAGAPVDAPGRRPLLIDQIRYGGADRATLEYLLAHGADPNAREDKGESTFMAATASPRNLWFAEQLLAKGANPDAGHISMYYGSRAFWLTPLLSALRDDSSRASRPGEVLALSERVIFLLEHGADPAAGGYGAREQQPRNGLNSALEWAARMAQPEWVDRLARAAREPREPLTHEPMTALLREWNEVESKTPDEAARARLRATAERLLAVGVPLALAGTQTGFQDRAIAPLSLPWLPDDLYLAWLRAGADPSDRTDPGLGLAGMDHADALPLVIMLRRGQEAKAAMLLEHGAGMFRTPARCGMSVAEVLAWQLSNNGPLGPAAARAVSRVLELARQAPACDWNQRARESGLAGRTAAELARAAGVTLGGV